LSSSRSNHWCLWHDPIAGKKRWYLGICRIGSWWFGPFELTYDLEAIDVGVFFVDGAIVLGPDLVFIAKTCKFGLETKDKGFFSFQVFFRVVDCFVLLSCWRSKVRVIIQTHVLGSF
jgi:hypothetical protein